MSKYFYGMEMTDEEYIEIVKAKRKYDAKAKNLLAHKEVIANILKYTVKEFEGYSLPEIMACLRGNPEVGTEPVDDVDFPHKMDIAGSETVSLNDGIRSFGIKFKVKIPNDELESDLIINIESQNDFYPGYTLEKRGIYYLSRLISSQYDVEFTHSNFDKLKKCYSIWICADPPKERQNTITEYRFTPRNIVGNVPDCPQRYDLMSLIMINLGSKDKNYSGLIKILDNLLIEIDNNSQKAVTILENEFDIPLESIYKEVMEMCNLSDGVLKRGLERGIKLGEERGAERGQISKSVEVVKNLLAKNFTLDEALSVAGISKETYEENCDKE
jgi:predicted transposase/invertase (TIGR01784 family)